MSSLNDGLIRDIVRRIVDTAQPEKVILFGSQATVSALLTVGSSGGS